MSHIFISYSRKDRDFVTRIVKALEVKGLDIWIDQEDIPKGEDWEQKIYRGIEEATAFMFMSSPDSVASEMCNTEISHALKNNKRILPIIIHDADEKLVRPEISKLNWIFCRDGQDDFQKAIEVTDITIHTNYTWVEFHTKLQNKALDWERHKDKSRLLRGTELKEAERRLKEVRAPKDPVSTDLMHQFVMKSRQVFDRQRKLPLKISGSVVLLIMILFVWQDKSWYRIWQIRTSCPAVGQVSVVLQNGGFDSDEIFGDGVKDVTTTHLSYCESYTSEIMTANVSSQNDSDTVLLTMVLPSTSAYTLDFLLEIREFGPELVSAEEAIKMINASSAYSVGNYQYAMILLDGIENQSAATLRAQTYLYLDEFEKSRDAYNDAIVNAYESGQSVDPLYMGKALAWWRPGLSQSIRESSARFEEFKLSNCERAKNIYLDVLSGEVAESDSRYYDIFLIASHYCGNAGWENLLKINVQPQSPDNSNLFSASLLDLVSESTITERNLESAGSEIRTARFELALYYLVHSEQSIYCDKFLASRVWHLEGVFSDLDKENAQYLLRQSCN